MAPHVHHDCSVEPEIIPSPQGGAAPAVIASALERTYANGETETRVLDDVCFEVPRGAFLSILGTSGSGKSTLLGLLGGIDRPDRGKLEVDGVNVTTLSQAALAHYRRAKVGFVFQFYNLLPSLTARENVEISLDFLPLRAAERRQRALDYLERVGVVDQANKFPPQLSGGQQQRVAIARALAREPFLLLADEPTGNLDRKSGMQVFECIRALQAELAVTCVMVTHDEELAGMTDDILYLRDGKALRQQFTPLAVRVPLRYRRTAAQVK
jgi:putative ABC transport system ATP-binding protein